MLKSILLCTAILFGVSSPYAMADNAKDTRAGNAATHESKALDSAACENADSKECRRAVKEEKLKKSLKVKEEPADGGMDLEDN